MPIPSAVSRSTFHGHLPGGEIFGWSLWSDEAPLGQAAAQTQADAFRDVFVAAAGGAFAANTMISSTSGYDGVTVYSYEDATGKATHIAEAAMTQPGPGNTHPLPNQCAVVVSLLTAVAGRRHKGRVYLPLTNFPLTDGGQIDAGFASGLGTYFATLIHNLNAAMGASRHIGVLSQVAGTFQPIVAVRVDTKVDIQRRRANRQGAGSAVTVPVT